MDSALDFDLLAEYLLEDLGASGGFDFSPENPTVTPPNVSNVTYQMDPGVVTPHQSDPSFFADPLSDPNLLIDGDMTKELSQVQQMIATQARAPAPIPIQQPKVQPQLPQVSTNPTVQAPVMAKTQPIAPAPTTAPQATLVRPLVPNTSQPNKRPRVDVPGVGGGQQAATPNFSLASASAAAAAATATAAQTEDSSKPKSQAQIDRRRERNRFLARRTRLRKKFFFESLQKDVSDLQRENAALKSIVRSRLKPDDAKALLSQCTANEKLPSIVNKEAGDENGAGSAAADGDGVVKQLDKEDFNLISSIQNSQQCFIITDPSLHDNPIVYASDDFLTLTGYSQDQVLGRNCRFLQGNETSQEKVALIRKAVKVGEDVSVTIANYTSDGTPFWNNLFIAALRDADNNIVNFIGVIVKVDGPEKGDAEYGKVLTKE